MKEKVLTLLIGFMALFLMGEHVQAQTVTLTSDQTDYLPGTTATFSGTGFQSGEIVKVQVLHHDGTSDGGEDHQAWYITADADGSIVTTWHVCEDDCKGSTLIATAYGLASFSQAEVIFTDAAFTSNSDGAWNNINTWGAVARTGTITSTTGSQTITGIGTLFLTEIAVGDRIQRNSVTNLGVVASIISNTTLILTVNATSSYSGSFMAKKIPGPEDAVIISGGNEVSITANASCLTLQVNSTTNFENTFLRINQGRTLTVGSGIGTVNIGTGLPVGYLKANSTYLIVDGVLQSGSIQQFPPSVSSGGYGNTYLVINSTGLASVNGNVEGTTVWNGTRTSEATVSTYGAGVLNLTGSLTTSQLILSANSTVNYSKKGPQAIRNSRYGNLTLSGEGKKSFAGGVTFIDGNLSINTATAADLLNFSHTASTLTLGGNGTASGTWGSTSSSPPATHTNNNFFAASTGKVTVAIATCTIPAAPAAGNNIYIYDGLEKTASAIVGQGETITWYAAATGNLLVSAPKGTDAGTYSAYAEAGSAVPGCKSPNRTLINLIISKAPVTVRAMSQEITYGNETATLNYTISGLVNSESTSVISGMPSLSSSYSPGVGVATSPVAINTAMGSLAALNYSFTLLNGEITINRKALEVTANSFKKEYGTPYIFTSAEFTSKGLVNGDMISSASITSNGAVASATADSYDINITDALGSGLDNYSITFKKGILNVEKRTLVISLTASDKVYNGSAIANTKATIESGLISGDVVTASSTNSLFDNKNAGNSKGVTAEISISGPNAGNYLTNEIASTSASITQKSLVITITAQNKVYDGNVNAATIAFIPEGLIDNDMVMVVSDNGVFNDKNVSNGKTVTADVSMAGTDAGNYSANTTATTTASITQKALIIAVAAQDKVYDGNTDAATKASIFSGLLADDVVTVSSKNGLFDNKNVGTAKVVTANVSKAGTDAGNYSANSTAATNANINQKALLVTSTADNKVYDGNAIATVVLKDDRVTDDLLSVAYTEASFADKNVGTEIPVSINGISIAGTDAGNYTFNTAAATIADITARVLSVTAYNESRYCGMENPTFTGSGAVGSINGETFAVSYTSPGTIASSAGYYPITPSISENTEGAILTNYSISLYEGNLTVNALISIDASASSSPVPLGSSAILSAKINPSVAGVLITFKLNGDIQGTGLTNTLGVATYTTTGLLPDVYTVEATAGSNCLAPTIAYLPVYDPNGGFVTGGGWILSPIVSGKTYMEKTGKANFGFVAKYKKGSNAVDGNTEFQFNAGNLNFKSQTHDAMSLVIAGAKAIYKGQGTINGSPGYSFMVSAIDGNKKTIATPDAFRIKIWNASTNEIVYDNQIDQPDNADATSTLGGGSVVIHQVGSKQSTITPLSQVSRGLDMRLLEGDLEQKINLRAYPNPFRNQASIAFTLPSNEQMVTLDVYDLKGSKISRMYEGKASANQTMEFNFNGSNLSAGMYFLRLTTPTKVENFKMIMTE